MHIEVAKRLRWFDSTWLLASHVAHGISIPSSNAEHYLEQLLEAEWVKSRRSSGFHAGLPEYRLHGRGMDYAMRQGWPIQRDELKS
jgi:hypothetical protein